MFNEGEQEAFGAVSFLFNSLSFCSCLWLFYLYIKSPSPYTTQFRMLVNLTLSDFLIAVTGFVTLFSYKSDRICTAFIFFSLVSFWSSAYWSSFVALFSYKKIAKAIEFNSNRYYNRSLVFWVLLCVLLPLLPAFGFFGIQYMLSDDICVISYSTTPLKFFLFTEGIPLMTAIIVTAVSYIKQIQALRNLPDNILTMINIKASKLCWYSIAQCLVFLPGLICQLVYIYEPYDSFVFNAIRLYGFRLAGLVNSLVYGLQRVKLGKSNPLLFGRSTRSESLLISESEDFYEYTDESAKGVLVDTENLF